MFRLCGLFILSAGVFCFASSSEADATALKPVSRASKSKVGSCSREDVSKYTEVLRGAGTGICSTVVGDSENPTASIVCYTNGKQTCCAETYSEGLSDLLSGDAAASESAAKKDQVQLFNSVHVSVMPPRDVSLSC